MSNVFEFIAEPRAGLGTIAARSVRREGKVPAIIYGGVKQPETLLLDHNEVVKHLAIEAVYSHVLDIKIGDRSEKAVLKHIQRHPARPQILHIDFQRVDETHKVKLHVPLHFTNEAVSVGVKKGGVVSHLVTDVEVFCLPSALPEFIEVDLSQLDVGAILHLSDLVLPAGVEIVALTHGPEHDHPVVHLHKVKGAEE